MQRDICSGTGTKKALEYSGDYPGIGISSDLVQEPKDLPFVSCCSLLWGCAGKPENTRGVRVSAAPESGSGLIYPEAVMRVLEIYSRAGTRSGPVQRTGR